MSEPARVHLHTRFDVRRKSKVLVDDVAEAADFIGTQKRGRATTEVELDGFAIFVELRCELCNFPSEIRDIVVTFVVIGGDDGGAAAEPAERFAERNVKVNREIARRLVVGLDLF